MRFWILESPSGNYVQIHRAECERCCDGTREQQGTWTGFDDYRTTMEHALQADRPLLQCSYCHPERFA